MKTWTTPLCLLVCLLVCLFTLAGTGAFAPLEPVDDFERAMLEGRYDRAVEIGLSIAGQNPASATAAYNVGCALSRAGQGDRAIEWLLKSAELGYGGVRSIRDDEDLEPVRSHAGFARVREAVEANARVRFERFRAAAEKSEPLVVLPPGHDPKTPVPLLIVLHETGGTGKGMVRAWRRTAARAGAILVAPDALRPQRGTKGFNWVFRDEAEWLVLRTIEQARERWAIGSVILAGFSQGANIALMLGQSHADRFDGVIPIGGHYEADVADLPTEGRRPRWYLMIGERDPWAPTYEAAERAFGGAGMTVHREEVAKLGHAMPRGRRGDAVLGEALRWALEKPQP